jgi:hypothetical protein
MTTVSVLPEAIVGQPYEHTMAVSGATPPYRWSVVEDAPPPGLVLDASTGVTRGTPRQVGKHQFRVRVQAGSQAQVTQLTELTVAPPMSGELVWRGELPRDRVLTIQDGKYASIGTLSGELPGVPVRIDIEPRRLAVVTPPSPENGWKLLVIHSGSEPRQEIRIKWTRVE